MTDEAREALVELLKEQMPLPGLEQMADADLLAAMMLGVEEEAQFTGVDDRFLFIIVRAALSAIDKAGYVLIPREPSEADIERMARAACFAGGCYACTDAADCGAWADFTEMRAAHAALVRGDDT